MLVENLNSSTEGITPPITVGESEENSIEDLDESEKILLRMDVNELSETVQSDIHRFQEIQETQQSRREIRQEKINYL